MNMTDLFFQKLKRSLIKHEGYEKFIYTDTKGKLTGGIGYNFTDRGLSDDWINKQFQEDADYFYNQLMQYQWFQRLNSDRKIVLIDMAFMGLKKFLEFKKMIAALQNDDYASAAKEMLNSKWASDVGQRAKDLANGMLRGSYNI